MQRIGWLAAAILLSMFSRDAALAAESTWMAAWRDGRLRRKSPSGWPASPRRAPAEGSLHDLWIKLLVLERRMASEA